MSFRILLSPPHLDGDESDRLVAAVASNWIAPVGPDLDAFEAELAAVCDRAHAVALASGTAALHLALLTAGIGPGDEVLVPTLTFTATVNAVRYLGATPVLIDADPDTWNLDLDLVAEELHARATSGRPPPAAIVPVDLYGRVVDHTRLTAVLTDAAAAAGREPDAVPVISDAAEALGAEHAGRPAGAYGHAAVLSFNGNKIITTSGGGALVTDDAEVATRVRFLATQAREPATHYEHREVGYNYRLSNLLAALGRGQLAQLEAKVARRRAINARYRRRLGDLPGLTFPPPDPVGAPSWWLTAALIDPATAGTDRDQLIAALAAAGIEARPVWKPMHLQPVHADLPRCGGEVAAQLFATGVCLPSGSALSDAEVDEVAAVVHSCWR